MTLLELLRRAPVVAAAAKPKEPSCCGGLVPDDPDPGMQGDRLAICAACDAVDLEGVALHRLINGARYCGRPRLQKLFRDETKEGCGCRIDIKASFKFAKCPLRKW